MTLRPLLRQKVDELFLRWLTDPSTQTVLRENLTQLKSGESLTSMLAVPTLGSVNGGVGGLPSGGGLISPRPQTPPHFPQAPHAKTVSPRSPRKHVTPIVGTGTTSLDSVSALMKNGKARLLNGSSGDLGPPSNEAVSIGGKETTSWSQQQQQASSTDTQLSRRQRDATENGSELDSLGNRRPQQQQATRLSPTAPSGTPPTSITTLPCPAPRSQQLYTQSQPVPQFYFPRGRPSTQSDLDRDVDLIGSQIDPLLVGGVVPSSKMSDLTKAVGVPLYWKSAIYAAAAGVNDKPVTKESVLSLWRRLVSTCYDDASRFIALLTKGQQNFLVPGDFYPLIQDILDTHPGLAFLQSAKDFHSRYVATVVSRIFFNVNSCWSGRITLSEVRRSNLLSVLASLDTEEDINAVTQYFSYEHFYVIYCKFWELDEDHDLIISKADLARHNNYAISERMIERIFSGAVTKGTALQGVMTYPDFVWFLLAEEDKRHPRSIEYWFRCMDLDGDGVLSMYELEYFYVEQLCKMEEMGIEPISFEDCLCQMLDMVKPVEKDKIRLSDLKRCKLCHIFFDTFFNLPKYLEHEQKDPFSNLRDIEEGLNEMSDWDRYAADAYEILVAEDNNQIGPDDYGYEDDYEVGDGGGGAVRGPGHNKLESSLTFTAGGSTSGTTGSSAAGSGSASDRRHFLDAMSLESGGGGGRKFPADQQHSIASLDLGRGRTTN